MSVWWDNTRAVTHQTITRRKGWVLLSLMRSKKRMSHAGHAKVATTDGPNIILQKLLSRGSFCPQALLCVRQASKQYEWAVPASAFVRALRNSSRKRLTNFLNCGILQQSTELSENKRIACITRTVDRWQDRRRGGAIRRGERVLKTHR